MNIQIQWLTVVAIALVQGTISVSWIIYRLYLPQLLVEWGLTKELATTLIIIETFLGIIIEPVFGSLSDRQQRWLGTRFPLISLGVIIASALFIALPSLVVFGQPEGIIRWLLPIIAIAWALAMTIFRTPVMVLLGMSAVSGQLPLAASILTATTGLIGAFRPLISKFILNLGAIWAFAIGSIVILAAAAILRQFQPVVHQDQTGEGDNLTTTGNISLGEAKETNSLKSLLNQISWSKLALIALLALGMSWGVRLLMGNITKAIDNPNYMIIFGVCSAIAAIPAGILALKIGNYKAMLMGALIAIVSVRLLSLSPSNFKLGLEIILLLIPLNFLLNGVIPLAIDWMPSQQIGLGIGVYFGTFGAAISLFEILLKPGTTTEMMNLIISIIAWFLVAVAVHFGYNQKQSIKL